MKMVFYTPANGIEEGFGAASFGFAGMEDEKSKNVKVVPFELNGTYVSGTYEECLNSIPEGKWQAVVALLGNAGNENEFIRTLSQKTKAPVVGGAGAINPQTGEKGLVSGRGQAAIFLINDENYEITVDAKNIHHNVLSKHSIKFTGRFIDSIDGCEPKDWLKKEKEKLGLSENDFEHLTFSDEHGINAHLSIVDGKVFSGRDLCDTMYLRYVSHNEVQKQIQTFYDDKDAVVFGCAGLKGILDKGLECDGVGLFMFGEVCTVNGYSDFGNLMLSKLKVIKK